MPTQVALSLPLVVVASLLSQSLIRLNGQHAGFDLDRVTITMPGFEFLPRKGGEEVLDLYQRMVDRLDQLPGIRSAAATWLTPMTGFQASADFQAASGGPSPPEDSNMAFNDVGPGYFRTMGTAIIAGREFLRNERDRRVCVVNRSAAEYLFPHGQAIGQYVRSSDRRFFSKGVACRAIGVAEDAKFASLAEPAPRTIYLPVNKDTLHWCKNLVFLLRCGTEGDAVSAYRQAVTELAPATPIRGFKTLHQQRDASLGSQRLVTLLSDFFAGLSLF